MVTAGSTQPARSRALALALALAVALACLCASRARPPPRSGPCALRTGRWPGPPPSLYAPPGLSREEAEPGARALRIGWQVRDTPARTPLCRGHWGRRHFREVGLGRGLCLQLGTFKGQIHVICPSARTGNTVSLQHVGRCIYSTRRLSLGPDLGTDTGPAASSRAFFNLEPARDALPAKGFQAF